MTNELKDFYKSILLIAFTCLSSNLIFPFKTFANSFPSVTISCNEKTPVVNGVDFDNLTASVTDGVSSTIPSCIGGVFNEDRLIDADLENYAFISITGLACDAEISVKDDDVDYLAGTFAGFKVSSDGLLQGSVGAHVTLRTYLDGTLQETYDAVTALVGVNSTLVDGDQNTVLGFITSSDFDEVRIEYAALVGVLFEAEVYHAVIETFCSGPVLTCNETASLANPTHPVIINSSNTGTSGVACAACSINDTENLINSNSNDYTRLELDAAVGTTLSVSVENVLDDYPAGSFAGFDINNDDLIAANVLSGLTVSTFLDGVLQESISSGNLISVNTTLLGGTGRQTVGFVTTSSFDEIKLGVTNLLGISSTTYVYAAVIKNFCPVTIACDTNYIATTPEFPVLIGNQNTGISGVACVACKVEDVQNILNTDTTDYAVLEVTAGLAAVASISVLDALTTYPEGSRVGFTIEDMNRLVQANLFDAVSICTYLDGTMQECKSATQLLDVNLLFDWIMDDVGIYNLGFITTKPFDEVQIKVSSLVSLVNTIHVYASFVDTKFAYGSSLNCCSSSFSYNCDFDDDGLINGLDLDADNDGVINTSEDGGSGFDPFGDEDQDGSLNFEDQNDVNIVWSDKNLDNINDVYDSDLDGIPNYLDVESDNDGVPDLIEANGDDSDNDGIVDSMKDTDGDGIPDSADSDNPLCIGGDSEPDGICDIQQLGTDTDGDGIDDANDPDANGNGLADIYDSAFNSLLTNPDTDGDGIPDASDLDSDNDGVVDLIEFGGIDTDGDGRVDQMLNPVTGDTNNNGMADVSESNPLVNTNLLDVLIDTDGDGISNQRDIDSDNDGVPELIELGGLNPSGNGLIDTTSVSWDEDGDGLIDIYDEDASDGPGGTGTNGLSLLKTNADDNANGKLDAFGELYVSGGGGFNLIHADRDSIPNHLDLDSDGDGILDVTEAGGTDSNGDGMLDGSSFGTNGLNNSIDPEEGADPLILALADSESDSDTRLEYSVGGATNALADTDGDDVPDLFDVDSDNDGVYDNYEAQPTLTYIVPLNIDLDRDGVDACYDKDESNFGTALMAVPGGLTPYNHNAAATNSDDVPDYRDTDSDNDGICDRQEVWDNIYDGDSREDNLSVSCTTGDNDGDGLLDCFDNDDNNGEDITWEGLPADDTGSTPGDSTQSRGTPFGIGSSMAGLFPNNDGYDLTEPDIRDYLFEDCSVPKVYYGVTEQSDSTTTNYEYNEGSGVHINNNGTGVVRATAFCKPSGEDYYYYYNPLEPENFLFAIRNAPGSPNTVPMDDLVDYIEIKVESQPENRWVSDAQDGTFVMERDWNVEFKGTPTPGSTFDVRFYFQPEEMERLDSISTAYTNAVPNRDRNSLVWFKKSGGVSVVDINTTNIDNSQDITSYDLDGIDESLTGMIQGIAGELGNAKNFVEFTGLSSFSGGTASTSVNSAPLPVELSYFNGEAKDCNANLSWGTEAEKAFDYYEVQRSIDNSNFETIEWIQGEGLNSGRNNYEFVDWKAHSQNYYRLKMNDIDGSFEYSKIIYVEPGCIEEGGTIVFPNPILKEQHQTINVEFIAQKERSTLIIVDLKNRQMKKETLSTVPGQLTIYEWDINDLPTGMYYLYNSNYDPSQTGGAARFVVTK